MRTTILTIVEEEKKSRLRSEIRATYRSRSATELSRESEDVMRQLEGLPQFAMAQIVALYWSMNDEISTHQFIEKWSAHKTILLPVVQGDRMIFSRFTSSEQMTPGAFNISEPLCKESELEIDLIVVPGVAFDAWGHRMGRGRGYYDKFLSKHSPYKVGVCFSHQLIPQVPFMAHDVVMDQVISATKV